jgi:hypothetical protein
MPRRSDFNPVVIPRLLADICLIEVIDGGSDYFYRVAGSRFEAVTGQKLQSRLFSELPHAEANAAMDFTCSACLKAAAPILIKGQLQEPGLDHQALIALILPLSDEEGTVKMILTMTEFEGVS